jgi:hypothetical protein
VFLCKGHKAVIPYNALQSHLLKKNCVQCSTALGNFMPMGKKDVGLEKLSRIVKHLAKALNIPQNQSLNDILCLKLAQPMEHRLPESRLSVQCPSCKSIVSFC